MGYYTLHRLEIIEGNDHITDYEKEIGELSDYRTSTFKDSIKWYDHKEHMLSYSKFHPKTLFKLFGEGEESGDLWQEYYLNGKMQRIVGRIIFDEYDKSKLE